MDRTQKSAEEARRRFGQSMSDLHRSYVAAVEAVEHGVLRARASADAAMRERHAEAAQLANEQMTAMDAVVESLRSQVNRLRLEGRETHAQAVEEMLHEQQKVRATYAKSNELFRDNIQTAHQIDTSLVAWLDRIGSQAIESMWEGEALTRVWRLLGEAGSHALDMVPTLNWGSKAKAIYDTVEALRRPELEVEDLDHKIRRIELIVFLNQRIADLAVRLANSDAAAGE
jgi:hypothetical protein